MNDGEKRDLEALRLNDRRSQIGVLVQHITRQGGGAWVPTERIVVPTDENGGGVVMGPKGALPLELVDRVPEDKRQWVTIGELRREQAELDRKIALLDKSKLSSDTLEQLDFIGKFVAQHLRTARRVLDRAVVRCAPPRAATAAPRLRQSQTERRSHRSTGPPSAEGDDTSEDGDPEGSGALPTEVERRRQRRSELLHVWHYLLPLLDRMSGGER